MQRHVVGRLLNSQTSTGGRIRWIRSYNSPSPSTNTDRENGEHQIFCHLLEACKLSLDIRTAVETHTRIIRFGYGNHPSLAASLISTYLRCDRLHLAYNVIGHVLSSPIGLVAMNVAIDNFMRIGEHETARKVFDRMPHTDVVTWNSMIGGYVRNARSEEALRLFRAMLSGGVEPDKFAFASVIAGCAKLGALGHARWVHSLVVEKGIELNSILSSALIDMYAKCGGIEAAREIFESLDWEDVSVWNSMINGLAVHGLGLDAIAVFSKMEVKNVLPDAITFLGILTACSHCGLVKEGRHYFDLMRSRYSIQPDVKHYGAMVDLLSRAGLLEDAYSMIISMPMDPDVVIWRAFLSACRIHRNPGLAEVAARNMSHLKSGDYVLLSNTLCSQNDWDSAEEVREMMRKKGIRKLRGRSWIEWAGALHRFKAGEKSHPETEAIYKVLEGLIQGTKSQGFVPTTDLVMMDVSEEEKEENLYHHSERLALAFGILKTSPGAEIRISKNLRICYDCHDWIKMVSRMLSRVIIVRDRIRFHRFEGGMCSCGDYW